MIPKKIVLVEILAIQKCTQTKIQSMVIIVFGVSGSGKSTVGKLIADGWEADFVDADDHHPPANIKKMESGAPLEDSDRVPWLLQLREVITGYLSRGRNLVMACSALKKSYREVLSREDRRVKFIYLKGDYETVASRLQDREGHFMPPELLRSQFESLEEPLDDEVIEFSIEEAPMDIAHQLLDQVAREEKNF